MRNLRLYKTDIEFKTYEEFCGGDGLSTKSIVPGVSMSKDIKKRYFNPKDEVVLFHEITINYKDKQGNTLAPSTTKRVKYISGVTSEIVLTPKNVEGFEMVETYKTVQIPEDTVVNFIYDKEYTKEDPLTFEVLSDGVIRWKAQSTAYTTTIEYRKNIGEWTSITSATGDSAPSISVVAGDIVQFRGDNATYGTSTSNYNTFSGTTCQFKTYGNIMSLIDSEGFSTATTLASYYTFYCLFYYCTGLTSAENLILPATTLASYCYGSMFQSCTNLTSAPELPAETLAERCYQTMFQDCTSLTQAPKLPATTLVSFCYGSMFQDCTSLTTAPALPATTLASGCYSNMFQGCTSLTTAPALPATTLASSCYNGMFYGCTSLTSAPAILPATTLISYCYSSMFRNCRNLATAPALPATTLVLSCYNRMFNGCTNLSYIKCLATNISATESLYNWVSGVQGDSGRFVKAASMTGWPRGVNGIPINWTVEDAS